MAWAIIGACVGFMWGVFLCDLLNQKRKENKNETGRSNSSSSGSKHS